MRSAVTKTYGALGMKDAGIKLIGPGDITQDIKLQAMGDAAVGLITVHHYNADLDNAANKALVASGRRTTAPTRRRISWRSAPMTAWPCSPT